MLSSPAQFSALLPVRTRLTCEASIGDVEHELGLAAVFALLQAFIYLVPGVSLSIQLALWGLLLFGLVTRG